MKVPVIYLYNFHFITTIIRSNDCVSYTMYIRAYVHTYMCMCVYVCTYICMYLCMCMYIHRYVLLCVTSTGYPVGGL